jgi:hypothetical protein
MGIDLQGLDSLFGFSRRAELCKPSVLSWNVVGTNQTRHFVSPYDGSRRMFTASELKIARFSNLDRAMLKERIILLGLR